MKQAIKHLLTLVITVAAFSNITVNAAEVKVELNGKLLNFDSPVITRNGRTFYPMRELFEALGAEVSWDSTRQAAIGQTSNKKVEFFVGSEAYTVNSTAKVMDTKAFIDNGKTYIPVRYAAEGLGFFVEWNNLTNTIDILGSIAAPANAATVPTNTQNAPAQPGTVTEQPTKPLRDMTYQELINLGKSHEEACEILEQEVIRLVNEYRAESTPYTITFGGGRTHTVELKPLVYDKDLARIARQRAEEITKYNKTGHISPVNGKSHKDYADSMGVSYKRAGELCAYGSRTAKAAVQDWKNSPGHDMGLLVPADPGHGFKTNELIKVGVGFSYDTNFEHKTAWTFWFAQ